jgi:type IV pilus assembly protein PilA
MLQAKLRHLREEKAAGDSGFTLIELLVVVVIIGILVAIAIPLYLNYRKGAENKSAASDLRGAISTLEQCYSDNSNSYPATGTQASAGKPMTFTCGTGTGTANASSGNTLTYTATPAACTTACTGYTITSVNSDGGKTYTYASATGGSVQ